MQLASESIRFTKPMGSPVRNASALASVKRRSERLNNITSATGSTSMRPIPEEQYLTMNRTTVPNTYRQVYQNSHYNSPRNNHFNEPHNNHHNGPNNFHYNVQRSNLNNGHQTGRFNDSDCNGHTNDPQKGLFSDHHNSHSISPQFNDHYNDHISGGSSYHSYIRSLGSRPPGQSGLRNGYSVWLNSQSRLYNVAYNKNSAPAMISKRPSTVKMGPADIPLPLCFEEEEEMRAQRESPRAHDIIPIPFEQQEIRSSPAELKANRSFERRLNENKQGGGDAPQQQKDDISCEIDVKESSLKPDRKRVGNLSFDSVQSPLRSLFTFDIEERYSRKVFVGGLPPDMTEDQIHQSFRRFGSLIVDWPHKVASCKIPPNRYAFLLFREESSVKKLLDLCIKDFAKYFICVSSSSIRYKTVQIRPWRLRDADCILDSTKPIEPRKTAFVGAVPRPIKAIDLAMLMDQLYGGVCYAGIDIDPEFHYPKGAARIAFSNQDSYIAAISTRFVQVRHDGIDKRIEVKPYVLDNQMCDECLGMLCGGAFAPFFCANLSCLQYYCEQCWDNVHAGQGRELHKPVVKDGADHIYFTRRELSQGPPLCHGERLKEVISERS